MTCPKCEPDLFFSDLFFSDLFFSDLFFSDLFFIVGTPKLCEAHQSEYDKWLNDEYEPCKCACGLNEWEDGALQMTEPPTFPLALVYRCVECNSVRVEKSASGMHRILIRKKPRQED